MKNLNDKYQYHSLHSGFTMIELVFVIAILGILSAIAIPRFAATRKDSVIAKGRADISSIRSSIMTERQSRLIIGLSTFIPNGTGTYTKDSVTYNQMDNGGFFGGILTYPIAISSTDDGWSGTAGSGTYIFKVSGSSNTFKYYDSTAVAAKRGKFLCESGSECSDLTH